MEFHKFNTLLKNHVDKMVKDQDRLYVVEVDKDILWNKYLDSFPEGTNPLFRTRREFDCGCCRNFVKSFGNVVAIKNDKLVSIWDFEVEDDHTFQTVINVMADFVKSCPIETVFVTSDLIFGTLKSIEQKDGNLITWNHFYYGLPTKFRNNTHETDASLQGHYNAVKDVFKRSLEEINSESLLTVSELIAQNSLYKGEEYKHIVDKFKTVHCEYVKIKDKNHKELFLWEKSAGLHDSISKIKNTVIGTLLIDLTNGVDVDEAVSAYERKTAPTNYKRPKAIFTARMIEDAKKTLEKEGLSDSLERRYATLEDITVNNILFVNRNVVKKLSGNPLDELMATTGKSNTKKFDRVEEIAIDKFIKDVLPNSTNLEVMLENRFSSNLVSLIASKNPDCTSLFKWDNRFSWAYNGNITDSMKERVKAAGGKVEGDLRFSIQWNDGGDCPNDFDAHCIEPNGNQIYFMRKSGHSSLGELDVDIQYPSKTQVAVENIIYPSRNKMQDGAYTFFVHNFANRGGRSGFSAEIEFDGQIFNFECRRDVRQGEKVEVAKVEYSKRNGFKMLSSLKSHVQSKKVWNLDTCQFHPVTVCMYSPNYWDEQDNIGHRHYFFMLKDCINDTDPNGFFNEFLKESLMKHKRVFEALGGKMKVEHSDNQLSGLGFSSTKRESLTVKVEGSMSRIMKVVF